MDAAFAAWWKEWGPVLTAEYDHEGAAERAYRAATERAAGIAEERFSRHAACCPATCRCADGIHIAVAIRGGG